MTKESSDAIVNLISSEMNMNNAGELSKAILREGGQQIQDECNRLGHQTAGSAVMTTGGNLAAPRVIHIIPGWNFFLLYNFLKEFEVTFDFTDVHDVLPKERESLHPLSLKPSFVQ